MSPAKKDSTILWWTGWIVLTILTFFVSCWFWTGLIAERVGDMSRPGVPLIWVIAVFGTWLVLLVPLIVVMYNKVYRAYEDARIAKEKTASRKTAESGVKFVFVDEARRLLKKELSDKLKKTTPAVPKSHLVTAILKSGRRVENVFVLNRKEILGAYGLGCLDFDVSDIVDVEPADLDRLPDFRTEGWLRFDGEAPPRP